MAFSMLLDHGSAGCGCPSAHDFLFLPLSPLPLQLNGTWPSPITTRKAGDITVVNPVGRINLGAGSTALRETPSRDLGWRTSQKLVLNLSGVSNMDSSGIGELVSCFTTTRSRGGVLKLAALPKRVSDLLRMTGIYKIFEIHDDEARAIRSFDQE